MVFHMVTYHFFVIQREFIMEKQNKKNQYTFNWWCGGPGSCVLYELEWPEQCLRVKLKKEQYFF